MLTPEQRKQCEELLPLVKKLARANFGADPDYQAEAALALCQAVERFDPNHGRTLKSWVCEYVTYKLLKFYHQRRAEYRAAKRTIDAGNVLESYDGAAALYGIWEDLPRHLHDIARARWIENLTVAEIARRLRLRRETVKQRINEARKYVHPYLEKAT
jgi:RNA polymerase sigma factor (sigma-70 family)